MTIALLFLILAFICFVLAAFGVPTRNINTVALGLAFWSLAILIGGEHLWLRA